VLEAGATAEPLDYEDGLTSGEPQKRLIQHERTLYRRDDLNGPLQLGNQESLALPFESYKLAFTPGLVARVYAGRVNEAMLTNTARYVHSEGDAGWWIPSGRVFYSPDTAATPAQELAYAREHFFLPHRYRDPFHTAAVSTETFVTYDRYGLLVQETRDALGNRITVGERAIDPTQPLVHQGHDYRVLQPALIMDPNRNRAAVAFDALGMVVGTAVMGKPEESPVPGDRLTAAFHTDLTQDEIDQFFANPKGQIAANLLGDATTRIVYDLTGHWREPDPLKKPPAVAATLARETHASEPMPAGGLRIQVSFSYSDGSGREVQKKIQAEPGPAPQRDAAGTIIVGADGRPEMTPGAVSPRWVGSSWTVFNNKGKPVRQYDPFFTDTHRFEFDVRIGVSPVLFYNPVDRVVATLYPNHTWEKVVFDPWKQETWDVSDTVLIADPTTDPDVGDFFRRLPDAEYLPTWHAQRQGGALGAQEQAAANKAAIHAETPTVAHADSLGRTFLTIAHNKLKYSNTPPADPPVEELYCTRVNFDIEGNQREVIDAKDRVVMRYDYDMLGNRVKQESMEAGKRWMFNDVAGKLFLAWDERGHQFRTVYDPLRRPRYSFLREGAGADLMVGSSVYGESRPNPEANNLRGQVVQVFDQAGVVNTDNYDFKGNLLRSWRQLAVAYKTTLNWVTTVPLQANIYISRTRYDALNRPIELTSPDNSVVRPGYNEASLLERVEVNLRGVRQNGQPVWTPFATNIDYDAKGQRTLIDYGNGVRTTYAYDPRTFRLVHLLTRRNAVAFPDDCPQPPPAGWPGCQVQNLHYTYDPAGNITHIRDDAQQTIYFRNRRVEPSADYTYDAVYRLIEATGREHLGQVGGAPVPSSYNDKPRVGILFSANDGNAMGRYLQRYVYDAVGNFQEMIHRGSDPVHPGWTRAYAYNEPSLLEPGKQSNRPTNTTIGAATEVYSAGGNGYDAHGNMLRMPHLQIMQWDFKDQLQMTQRQAVNADDEDGVQRQGERTWYVYDAGGQRVRKVTELASGQVKDERIYLGAFEIYRRQGADPLVRETLHIMDDKQRISLVETRTNGNEPDIPAQLVRFQFGNHLGSASLELDEQARLLSYEEYTPYGGTSYQMVRSQTETPKRYRYTDKERDEETGFYYHGARYYAPWLGLWTSADPAGMVDGPGLYTYCRANPVRFRDPNGRETKTYLGSSTEWKYVERLQKTWSGNQYWSASGSNGAGWYVRTEGSRILPYETVRSVPDSPAPLPPSLDWDPSKAGPSASETNAAATIASPRTPPRGHQEERIILFDESGDAPISRLHRSFNEVITDTVMLAGCLGPCGVSNAPRSPNEAENGPTDVEKVLGAVAVASLVTSLRTPKATSKAIPKVAPSGTAAPMIEVMEIGVIEEATAESFVASGNNWRVSAANSAGAMTADVYAESKSIMRGGDLFDISLDHFGKENVPVFKGMWMPAKPDNLNTYRRLRAEGKTPLEAASGTFSGKVAKKAGYSVVDARDITDMTELAREQLGEDVGELGVTVLFRRQ
jgi:RHS repeat-associated protein